MLTRKMLDIAIGGNDTTIYGGIDPSTTAYCVSIVNALSSLHAETRVRTRSLRCICLFAGGGGLHLGLRQAGFETLFATDVEGSSAETFTLNFPDVKFRLADVRRFDRQTVMALTRGQKVDLIAGGPPCQGFTTIGDQIQGDIRNSLFEAYLRIVDWVQPNAILIENVNYLRTQYGGRYEQEIVGALESRGYNVSVATLNADRKSV